MSKAPVDAVETSLEVLRCLDQHGPSGITDLATRLDRPKATIYYHLQTLQERGYVVRRDTEYDLGLRTLRLGARARTRRRQSGVVESGLHRLASEANEVAVFGIEEQGQAVITDIGRPLNNNLEVSLSVGSRWPLHASALGKALLAALPDERRESLLEGYEFEEFTEATITNETTLRDQLATVRTEDQAHNRGEFEPDVHGIAAPVTDTDATPVGSVGIVGPASRLYSDRFTHELPHLVKRTAERLGQELES